MASLDHDEFNDVLVIFHCRTTNKRAPETLEPHKDVYQMCHNQIRQYVVNLAFFGIKDP